jgi:hypothetical protein
MLTIIIVVAVLAVAFIGGALVFRNNKKTADKAEAAFNAAKDSLTKK